MPTRIQCVSYVGMVLPFIGVDLPVILRVRRARQSLAAGIRNDNRWGYMKSGRIFLPLLHYFNLFSSVEALYSVSQMRGMPYSLVSRKDLGSSSQGTT